MPIARLSNRVMSLAKAQISGGGGGEVFIPPNAWMTATYGSGWPIKPVTPPQDIELPRTIDYPISVNATLTPRTGYGHMPFAALLEAYENVTEVRTPVELLHRELSAFVPHLVDSEGNEVQGHDYQWMCEMPDGETPFAPWLTRLIKCAKVYDAPAVYLGGDPGKTTGLHFIDGSTLFIIVDEYGKIPKAETVLDYITRRATTRDTTSKAVTTGWPVGPTTLDEFVERLIARNKSGLDVPSKVPAYTQIIKGTPFSWWSADQIWYMPKSPRMNSPYGESFIEIAWSWIMILVNITAFELGHYRTGNMPEGFVTLPREDYSDVNQLLAQELMYNQRMSSNPATERMRLRFFPDGSKYIPTKKPDFPDKLYLQAWKNVLHALGVPPSEFGDIPGGGLGGKGFKEGAMSDLSRNTLNPIRQAAAEPFNYVLERDGVDDVHFELSYPMDQIDPEKQRETIYDGMAHGTLSLNDALGELNLDPVGDPDDRENIANKHLIVAGNSIYVVEDMQTSQGMAVPTFSPQAMAGGATGGEPVGPETAAQQAGATHTPEDHKTVEKLIRQAVQTGKFTLDNKTYVIMPGARKLDATHEHVIEQLEEQYDNRVSEIPPIEGHDNKGTQKRELDPEQFAIGVREEAREHPTLASDLVEQLVRDHLNENPDYYAEHSKAGPGELFSAQELRDKANTIAPNILQNLLDKGAESGDVLGVWQNVTTGKVWIKVLHGAQSTLAAIRAVCGKNSMVATESAPAIAEWVALKKDARKVIGRGQLTKHCGVCPEDDDYFDAPVSREAIFDFPAGNHANGVEIVAMSPEGLPPKAALWKPEGGEVEELQNWIGGPQFPREEATYLLDRSLGFRLVPVAYVTESHSEVGAAIYYTFDAQPPKFEISEYAPEWIERAAVLDYISSQQDRGPGHNYLTHPDDSTRPILFDNGLAFPVNPEMFVNSPFAAAMVNKPLSTETLKAITACLGDAATWHDILALVGSAAVKHARECAQRLLDNKAITSYSQPPISTGTPPGTTPLDYQSDGASDL